MTEYWKSLPKKYCDVCKCWFTDNKASVDFHERGFKHKGNVRRKLYELQKRGSQQEKERIQYNNEMLRIEAAALRSFETDISKNANLAKELIPSVNKLRDNETKSEEKFFGNRFGETSNDEESQTLVHGREKAFETIAKKFEKKSKWFEAQTSDGKTYYWNKETFETKWKPPKSGFLTLEEQKYPNLSFDKSETPNYRYDALGQWKTVQNTPVNDKMIDLQLPNNNNNAFEILQTNISIEKPKETKIEFKEKTVETLSKDSKDTSFKKRKFTGDIKRNVRRRDDDDD